jgi:HK97 family phage major capsid protein
MYAFPYITQKSIDDLAFNVESWLQGRIGNRFAQIEGAAFVEGTGSGQPFGLLTRIGTGTDTIGYVAGGHATLLKADALIELVDDMPRRYQANGSFLMHRSTRRLIRQLKDGAGNYLWERSIQGGQPSTLLGFPIYEATNMDAPSSGAYTTNQYAALFGDFRAAYTIVDRQGIRVLRDPYSAKPYIGYYVTYRVGGDVVDTAAIKALKIATS